MKLDILGTEYEYKITTAKEDTTLCDKSGYCDGYAKIIAIEDDFNEADQNCIKDFSEYKKKVKRHECVHAMFYESGLTGYADDEQLVDWIAWQFPKLLKTFEIIGAL